MNEPHEKYFLQNMLVLNIYALNLNKLQKSVYKPSKEHQVMYTCIKCGCQIQSANIHLNLCWQSFTHRTSSI